ncbi:MAG: hypothetical protein ACR2IV_18810 [Bryobacteraceae bacterium]
MVPRSEPGNGKRCGPFFELAQKMLEERCLMSWDRLCLEVSKILVGKPPFTHVIADEFQDLGPSDLKFLRSLGNDASALENAVAFSHISTARRLLHFLYSDSAQNPSLGIILGLALGS